jgi:hypothetical protein
MARSRTLVCAYCARPFVAPIKSGPPPRYCTPAHRQRAYEHRRAATKAGLAVAAVSEVGDLRARVRRLEYDNQRLRDELARVDAEARRLYRELHPLPPGAIDFSPP